MQVTQFTKLDVIPSLRKNSGWRRASIRLEHGVTNITLRITVHEEPEQTTVRLEGRMSGPWVTECDRAYRAIASSLGSRRLQVDLRGVTHLDEGGRQLLGEIHRASGAEFVADTPMTKYFAQEARGHAGNRSKGEA